MEQWEQRRCGALGRSNGSVQWRVWAPRANQVDLVLIDGDRRRRLPMEAEGRGYFRHTEAAVPEGQRYAYRLGDGPERPDPCSLWQPDGVHRPSAVLFPERFPWSDAAWVAPKREELVFYELHVGAFTPEGTFDAVIPRLAALRDLGVTAVELMPVAQFPGAKLGLRRRSPFRPAEQLRRPARPGAARGRLPCARLGGLPRRGLQPLRAGRKLRRRVRSLLFGSLFDTLGAGLQLRRPRFRPRARFCPRQRAPLDRGLPLRRPAARRRSRHARRPARPHPPRNQGDGRRGGGTTRTTCRCHRGKPSERRAGAAAAGTRRLRPRRRMARRLSAPGPCPPDGRTARQIRRFRPARLLRPAAGADLYFGRGL